MDFMVKQNQLEENLAKLGKVVVAFSGGVDSAYLLAVAKKVLGGNVLAITVESCLNPDREAGEAAELCAQLGVRQIVLPVDALAIPEVSSNPPDRCYHCKRNIFGSIIARAKQEGFGVVADGSNVDDMSDYRPGAKAVAELGVISPLQIAGFTKADIRAASQAMGLPTWDKQSFACLASRFPYGDAITPAKLAMVDGAEQYLLDRGFKQVRVRIHGDIARIELPESEMDALYALSKDGQLQQHFKGLGFKFVTMDLTGYKTGSMNAGLDK